ncbi:MAG: carboxypeptidase regulatory-like domain-containing protein [Gemmatimonadetes bacterium]|nr:carboxypeptidase regulatory-like domain-containing protein [Gemmatimonadota bacterium]
MGEKYLATGEWVGMDMRVPYISATLVGVVRDGTSLAPISHGTVAVSAGAEGARAVAAVTDRFGAFTVPRTPRGPLRVRVSAFGYRPWEGAYEEPLASLVEVLLAPQPIALDSLGVTASIRTRDPLSLSPYAFAVDPAIVRAMPALVESDVLRVLSLSPSASAVSDYMAVPYVRGGTGEGTPIMLDGVRLFNPFHLGGFFSAVNADAVQHAALFPSSGAGAQHIGSLSGVIEKSTRDGARDRRRAAGSVGLASSHLTVEGPLGEGMSYLASGRRTHLDLMTKLFGVNFPYHFSDMHVRVVKDLSGVRRMSLTAYLNSESYWATDAAESWRDDFDWGSAAVVATTATGRRAGECWTSRRVTAASTTECSNSSGWTSRCLTRSPWSLASWPRIVSTRAASGT